MQKEALSLMNSETQLKTFLSLDSAVKKFTKIVFISSLTAIISCSFVELKHGAENIIFANSLDSCQKISEFHAKVAKENFMIDRTLKAIADELQILAQNEAYRLHANAIWPSSEIENGEQNFDILRCTTQP